MDKNIIVRFYWQHDPDLIILLHDPRLDNSEEKNARGNLIKNMLKAYIHGEDFPIAPPPKPNGLVKIDSCAMHFSINLESEKELNDFLNSIREGYRNSVIKSIMRFYYYRRNGIMTDAVNNPLYIMKSKSRKKSNISGMPLQVPPMPAMDCSQEPESQPKVSVKKPKKAKQKSKKQTRSEPKPVEKPVKKPVEESEPDDGTFDFFGAIDQLI